MNINKVIKEFEDKITMESSHKMTPEQSYYVAGLSDGLEIVKSCDDDFTVGQKYFVLMPDGDVEEQIIEMQLYKITFKSNKVYYTFRRVISVPVWQQNELTLSNETSLKLRVFNSYEEAKKNKNNLWRFYKKR